MRYRLALFDFDGTLADSFAWFFEAINEVAAEMGFRRVDWREAEALRGEQARLIMRRLGVRWWQLPAIARRMRQLVARDVDVIRPFPGVPEMLRRLKEAGVVLAVVTSNAEANVRRVLGEECSALVSHWECGASLFGKTPRIRRLLRVTRTPPAQAICIGDEQRDHEAARGAGVPFGAVSWGFNTRDSLAAAGPTRLFDRVDEIVDWLVGA